jgi:hypothetical protein
VGQGKSALRGKNIRPHPCPLPQEREKNPPIHPNTGAIGDVLMSRKVGLELGAYYYRFKERVKARCPGFFPCASCIPWFKKFCDLASSTVVGSKRISTHNSLPSPTPPAKLSTLQAPKKLETLEDLMLQGEHYAHFCMHNSGRMSPTLFLIGPDGPMIFMPETMADSDQKDHFANMARLVAIAHASTSVVMVMEVWIKKARADQPLDLTEPPSEAFDREEAVVLMGESRTARRQKYLPIIRSGNGKFFGFGPSDLPEVDHIEGRFAGILPEKAPTPEQRAIARALLEGKTGQLKPSGSGAKSRR